MSKKNNEETQVFLVRVTKITPPVPRLGRPAQDLAVVSKTQNIRFASEIPRIWLFQSNPQLYDLRAALRSLDEQVWSVSRYAKEIKIGDKVYLWEAGTQGGVIARGEIFEPPCIRPEPWEQLPFIRVYSVFLKERTRTKLKIVEVFDPLIARHSIASNSVFCNLGVLRCPRGTNFRLTEAEAQALDGLVRVAA
jgi:hypothetical protein